MGFQEKWRAAAKFYYFFAKKFTLEKSHFTP